MLAMLAFQEAEKIIYEMPRGILENCPSQISLEETLAVCNSADNPRASIHSTSRPNNAILPSELPRLFWIGYFIALKRTKWGKQHTFSGRIGDALTTSRECVKGTLTALHRRTPALDNLPNNPTSESSWIEVLKTTPMTQNE